jgi:two-component system nitrate/nitrite response regulator NarL
MFSEALSYLIRDRGHEAFVCSDPTTVFDLVHAMYVDVCVMELIFDGEEGGISWIRKIKAERREVRIVVLSGLSTEEAIEEARLAGADAFVAKGSNARSVLDVVCGARRDDSYLVEGPSQTWLPSIAARARTRTRTRNSTTIALDSLTVRERQVLNSLVAGASNSRIAQELGITYSTARSHVQRILTKLGVRSRLEAAAVLSASRSNPSGIAVPGG